MKLRFLLHNLKRFQFSGDEAIQISDIAYHSANVKPGCCFVAIRGLKTDGHSYVADAIAKGAKAILVEKDISVPKGIAKIVVEDSRDCLARLSSFLFGEPTKDLRLVGITGTNGKTTTAHLIDAIWQAAHLKTGLISTLCYRFGEEPIPAERTTPESYDLQKMFRDMVSNGVTDCVMEVTSHALDLKRVVGCHFDGAIFTNLSQDHLDYHENMESYFACKAKLLRERLVVSEKRSLWAVLNWDDPYGKTIAGGLPAKVLRFSFKENVDVSLGKIQSSLNGLKMEVKTPQGLVVLSSPLLGFFNAANILAAVCASLAMEISLDQISFGVASFHGVPGRLERIPNTKDIKVFVDYAHTPAALDCVLRTLRDVCPKKVICVFGCGGDRDRSKRPLMAKVVEQFSDVCVVTSDNPRSEDPQTIIDQVVQGFRSPESYVSTVDRRAAIANAIGLAGPGDCVLIAGKGHETYQEAEGVKNPFDDREVVKELLQ